jgi:hypothetical protein
MQEKKIYTSLAAAALVLIVVFVIAGRWPGTIDVTGKPQEPGDNPSATSTPQGALEMEVMTISEDKPLYTIRAEYPRFPSVPALTSEVDAYVKSATEQFVKNVQENDDARRDTAPAGEEAPSFTYSLNMSWQPAQLNARYVSFAAHLDAFEGGANLRQEVKTFNYDLQANRAVTLADLFPGDSSYLQRLSEYARQVLSGNLGENTSADFLDAGTRPTLENFAWFTFTPDVITLTFPKYQVAPGAAGAQEVTVPRNVEGLF